MSYQLQAAKMTFDTINNLLVVALADWYTNQSSDMGNTISALLQQQRETWIHMQVFAAAHQMDLS